MVSLAIYIIIIIIIIFLNQAATHCWEVFADVNAIYFIALR